MFEPFRCHGEADQTAAISGHEIDCFRSDLFRCQGQIPFIFAVFIVHDHNHASGADLFDGCEHVCKWRCGWHFVFLDAVKIVAFRLWPGPGCSIAGSLWRRNHKSTIANSPSLAYNFCMAKSSQPFEVGCPCCGAVLKVDPGTKAVISHVAPLKPKMFADLDAAAKAMREQDVRKESIFRQAVDAEKNKTDLLEKKFQEAVKRAKEMPDEKFVRDIDLD